ncbi:MAG: hypothetical protein U0270_14435 [Labilithrix sp.]
MRRFALLALLVLGPLASYACRIYEPSNKPLDNCHRRCVEQAKRQCSDDECWRGCEFILDRLIEREGQHVIACVAKGNRRCTDVVWADCATRVGYHADGGPPGPAPPVEED